MRVLMCPPLYFKIAWENPQQNPWMKQSEQPRFARAFRQWAELVEWYRQAGITVHFIEAVPSLPDMVFAANAGWVESGMFVYGELAPPARKNEALHYKTWFENQWLTDAPCAVDSVFRLPRDMHFEGQGDIVTTDAAHLYCYGGRNDVVVPEKIRGAINLDRPMLTLYLKPNSGFYHGDLALLYLRKTQKLLFCPDAFDAQSIRTIHSLGLNTRELPRELAIQDLGGGRRNFPLNGVDIGSHAILPFVDTAERLARLGLPPGPAATTHQKQWDDTLRWLRDGGVTLKLHDFSEFGTSGAGHRCATLVLER